MYTIKPIETKYDGYRFRARTEARYAVMFRACGLPYEFELQGYSLERGAFLPDFYLSRQHAWLEVKGPAPTFEDEDLCQCLAKETGEVVAIAQGQPSWETVLVLFSPEGNRLTATLPEFLMRWVSSDTVAGAIDAARSARFEHGETPKIIPFQSRRISQT